ncbi:MAG: putative toxin-antitoxin system toxin component, PIN family [Rubrivivax sp.]|nr:putative toxin-antitoxin system toxin component, PIN family [Rubrivivax sp.]
MPASAPPLRLVLDTNVVVAGLLWNGPPRRLMELAIGGEAVELFSSPVLLDELAHTLGYAKFAARIEGFATSVGALVAQYSALVTGDRKHLLPIGTHHGIAIVTASEVLDRVGATGGT